MARPHAPALALGDIQAAQARIRGSIHHTPVLTSRALDQLTGVQLYFKCENFQRSGSFKVRGAHNAVLALTDAEASCGVATHSSGNHGAALALAARTRGIPAHIVAPHNAPQAKLDNIRRYGGVLRLCEPTQQAREQAVAEVIAETGARLVHPYDDPMVQAGQGTAALELLTEVPDLDLLLTPLGGGGLLGGSAVAAKALRPAIRVVGAEPEGAADAALSLANGQITPVDQPASIADGLLATIKPSTFALIRSHVDAVVTVPEDSIIRAMRLAWEVLKIVIEPSSAVPLAALLEQRIEARGCRTGIIFTGGNVDLSRRYFAS